MESAMPNRHFYFTFLLGILSTIAALSSYAEPIKTPTPATQASSKTPNNQIEDKALKQLKAMSQRLASTQTIAFTAVISYESPSRIGPPLLYTTKADVLLQRPNKLRILISGDGPASEFYYDGKTMMVYAPAENMVAIADAPATIDGALKLAYDSAATYFPFSDVIAENPYKEFSDDLIRAFVIGQSTVVGNTSTDMLAIENPWVFEQIWIGTEDHLPRMMRAVFRSDPLRLRHQIEFSHWKLNGRASGDAFTSSAASKAKRVPFAAPKPMPEVKNNAEKTRSQKTTAGGA
jgi:hypothetical protein